MKVCVFMWYDSTINDYAELNYKINLKYCQKYGIELIKCNERRHIQRHPAWERIPLLLNYINNYDYVIWKDADAHFYLDSINIVTIIKNHPEQNFIFSKDINVVINTGIFIVKNTI